jgi:hypothetical protein
VVIVDMTRLRPGIHCRHDPSAVNDPVAAGALRRQLENSYADVATDLDLLRDGTVVPVSPGAWREALQRLRRDRPGHYFAPVFEPRGARGGGGPPGR